jgi:hypothetical protein
MRHASTLGSMGNWIAAPLWLKVCVLIGIPLALGGVVLAFVAAFLDETGDSPLPAFLVPLLFGLGLPPLFMLYLGMYRAGVEGDPEGSDRNG